MRVLDFDPEAHAYFLDGVRVGRSVTGVLKRAGLLNFDRVPAATLERARLRGQIVHQALHYLNEGDLDLAAFAADYPLYMGYIEAWRFFVAARDFRPLLCERRVCDPDRDVAGTIDCLGTLDGRAVLLDFATGDPADAAKDLQTAGYVALAAAWRDNDPAIDAFLTRWGMPLRYAVALRSDGTFSIEGYRDPKDTRAFFALVDAQRITEARRKPRTE